MQCGARLDRLLKVDLAVKSLSPGSARHLAAVCLLLASAAPALADACSSARRSFANASTQMAGACADPDSAHCAAITGDTAGRARAVLSRCMGRLAAEDDQRLSALTRQRGAEAAARQRQARRCQSADGYIGPDTGSEFADGLYRLTDQTDFFQNHMRYQVIQAHRRRQCQGG